MLHQGPHHSSRVPAGSLGLGGWRKQGEKQGASLHLIFQQPHCVHFGCIYHMSGPIVHTVSVWDGLVPVVRGEVVAVGWLLMVWLTWCGLTSCQHVKEPLSNTLNLLGQKSKVTLNNVI